jgi:hypothetical protein
MTGMPEREDSLDAEARATWVPAADLMIDE